MGNQESKGSLGQGFGYRIISISENSPCSLAGINFFTDFIIDVTFSHGTTENIIQAKELLYNTNNQIYKINEKKDFFNIISTNENKPIGLIVFNALTLDTRYIEITPNKSWSQLGNLLGVTLRLENYLNSPQNSFRVLNVDIKSPAQKAGLTAKSDYVIGLKKYKYEGLDEFINIILENEGTEIELLVFSTAFKAVRSVILKPQANWGGRGLVGCEFASGFLNQLPQIKNLSDENNGNAVITDTNTNESISKDTVSDAKPLNPLSSGPPPTYLVENSVSSNSPIPIEHTLPMAHSHHLVHQLHKKQERKVSAHKKENFVPHITDPFATNNIQESETKQIQQQQEQNYDNKNMLNASSAVENQLNQQVEQVKTEVNNRIEDIQNSEIKEEIQLEEQINIEVKLTSKYSNVSAGVSSAAQDINQIIDYEASLLSKVIKEKETQSQSPQRVKSSNINDNATIIDQINQIKEEQQSEIFLKQTTNESIDLSQIHFEFDCPSLGEAKKYMIPLQNLFQIGTNIPTQNLLLDENEIKY